MFGFIWQTAVFLLGSISFICGILLITACRDYKNISDEKEKKSCKSEIKTYVITLLFLLIALTGCIIGTSVYFKKEKLYEYKEVTSTVETIETLHEVRIDRVVSEKDRESIYYITLSNNKMVGSIPDSLFNIRKENHPLHKMINGDVFIVSEKITGFHGTTDKHCFDEIKLVLSESEYNSIIGSGNNHLRMDVHILSLTTEKFHGKEHGVVLYRLGCFGEVFPEAKVDELSKKFLDAANAKDCEDVFANDVSADFVVVHKE